MSEREFATYSENTTKTQLDHSGYPFPTNRFAGAVRENTGFYIPEIVTEEAYRANPDLFAAAFGHAKNLSEAQRMLDDALDLVRTLSGVPVDGCLAPAAQYEATRMKIEKKLRKVSTRLVKHGCRHTNLFLVYFDLRGRIDAASG